MGDSCRKSMVIDFRDIFFLVYFLLLLNELFGY